MVGRPPHCGACQTRRRRRAIRSQCTCLRRRAELELGERGQKREGKKFLAKVFLANFGRATYVEVKGEYTPGGRVRKTHSKKIFLHLLLLPFFQGQNEREAAGWRKRKRERETLSFPASSSLFAPPPLSSPLTPFRGSGERGIFRNAQEQKYRSKAPSFCRMVRLFSQKMCTEKGDRTFPSRFDFGFSFSLSPVFPFLPRRSCGEERKTLPTSAYSAK